MDFADFAEQMLALSLVFLNVITPVIILVAVGYFIGPLMKIEARPLSKMAYFVIVPAFVFNVISEAKKAAELAILMQFFYFCGSDRSCRLRLFSW